MRQKQKRAPPGTVAGCAVLRAPSSAPLPLTARYVAAYMAAGLHHAVHGLSIKIFSLQATWRSTTANGEVATHAVVDHHRRWCEVMRGWLSVTPATRLTSHAHTSALASLMSVSSNNLRLPRTLFILQSACEVRTRETKLCVCSHLQLRSLFACEVTRGCEVTRHHIL